jgi:hypothetical protein
METLVTGLLLVAVLTLPTAIVVVLFRVLRRHGVDPHWEHPDTIDYDKW